MVFHSASEEETLKFGLALSSMLKTGDIVLLHGGLGAGKSVLTRGIANGIGIRDPVTSPTFNILNIYCNAEKKLYHFDLYRIADIDELYAIDFEEYISDNEAITVIEWPDIAKGLLPGNCIDVWITSDGMNRCFDIRIDEELEKQLRIESLKTR